MSDWREKAKARVKEPRFGLVYAIVNKLNGKAYVGKTTKPTANDRWISHYWGNGGDHGSLLNLEIKRWGSANFEVIELASAHSREQLDTMERVWVLLMNSIVPCGYNLTSGGAGDSVRGKTPWNKGKSFQKR